MQEVLTEVEVAVGEEAGAGRMIPGGVDRPGTRVAHYAEMLPGRLPEVAGVLDRPAVELPVSAIDAHG